MLLIYVNQIDQKLSERIIVIAVGGTAMCLMGLKESTKDVDFCIATEEQYNFVREINKKIVSPFKIDLFYSGYIFTLQLPQDYIFRSRSHPQTFKNITLKILSPIDIIITKTARLNQRDIEDIETIIKHKKINKTQLIERFHQIKTTYAGNERIFEENFNAILKEFF